MTFLMSDRARPSNADITFSVPFTHRLRITDDVCGDDYALLGELLDGGETGRARVLLVSERALKENSQRLQEKLSADTNIELVAETMWIDGGEASKNSLDQIKSLLQSINETNLDRRSYVIVIGGGAVLDAVGFAAAIAHRGIRLVRIPTTTLAQADSGVGVKNAINYFDKKNWVGTFAVPWAVFNDSRLLDSLPDRDFRSGFSEAVKVSLLKDPHEFEWLCEQASAIRQRDLGTTQRAISRSCQLHLDHITNGGDPFEMLEARPLDFGHWSAHRLEPRTQYTLRHGEAVAIGVAIDCIYSSLAYGFPSEAARKVCDCLRAIGITLWHPAIDPIDELLKGLEEFRQHLGGRLTVTMLKQVGQPVNVHEIDEEKMREAIETLRLWQEDWQPDQAPS
jgi:3-dehydroquinate synthase